MRKTDKRYYIKSKSKTFYKGDPFHETIDWIVKSLDTDEWQPEGTDCGLLSPPDLRCDLAKKYVITIKKLK